MLFNTYEPFLAPFLTDSTRSLDYEVARSEEGVTIRIDIPGVDPETVDLTVDGRSLRLEVTRSSAIPEGARIVTSRRRNGDISQTFELGERLDTERLVADYEFGVLTVKVPVAESAKPRKVTVGATTPAIETIEGDSSTSA